MHENNKQQNHSRSACGGNGAVRFWACPARRTSRAYIHGGADRLRQGLEAALRTVCAGMGGDIPLRDVRGGEPYAGQQAIANCILNKCRMTGKRPSEVIRSDQYATWATGYTESVKSAVLSVFEDGCRPVGDYATIFYAPQRMPEHRSAYHDSQIYVCTIGGHKFFVERRYADLTEKSHPRAATLMVAGTK